ncbi:hypothetical protein, unlikely [Trypanosoma brucei gambiense DAL972]|uniref:Uncharacterized protein n=1 Tax=Trypanosoma brucei gambiense (strain MHOM/CI/86/DAL972) TaxID=679716 RepID=C9ZKX8_TRYB9|nr:hypothetical protein, unlikely [Trypanosoma brucei gambiense DAL972]CBH09986.1 hypothetical protein, unlikely [Trypanosoma brucei gambiense DAL972]|eukprot:XP_011772277.1 hypothetical protein, unlikely [Trypanosoma brucei gambiense DAL972]
MRGREGGGFLFSFFVFGNQCDITTISPIGGVEGECHLGAELSSPTGVSVFHFVREKKKRSATKLRVISSGCLHHSLPLALRFFGNMRANAVICLFSSTIAAACASYFLFIMITFFV